VLANTMINFRVPYNLGFFSQLINYKIFMKYQVNWLELTYPYM
jgi:hypothetical protein